MSFSLSPDEVKKNTSVPRRPYLIGIFIWIMFLSLGVVLILNYGVSERERELVTIQRNLGEVAGARASDLGAWVEAQKAPLAKFAADEDVRLNLFQISEPSADLDLGARGYLRNWLADLAQKNGFVPQGPANPAAIDANVPLSDLTGMTLLGKNGEVVLSIGSYPSSQPEIKQALENKTDEGVQLIDLFKNADGKVYLGFFVALYDMNGTAPENRLGYLVGIKPVEELFLRLAQPGSIYKTSQVLLLRARDGVGDILSPLPEKPALTVTFDAWDGKQLESAALSAPGTYVEGVDYAGRAAIRENRSAALGRCAQTLGTSSA